MDALVRRGQQLNLTLIELAKPHVDVLASRAHNSDAFVMKNQLWKAIAEQMNQTFNIDRTADDYRTRFKTLRRRYADYINMRSGPADTFVVEQLEFLRPYTSVKTSERPPPTLRQCVMEPVNFEEANTVDLKLIDHLQPQVEAHYVREHNGKIRTYIRPETWEEIAAEMNRAFNLNGNAEYWKKRWQALRALHTAAMKNKSTTRPIIVKRMDFLLNIQENGTNRKRPSLASIPSESGGQEISSTSNQPNRANSCGGEQEEYLIFVDSSDSDSDCKLLDDDDCFEISDDNETTEFRGFDPITTNSRTASAVNNVNNANNVRAASANAVNSVNNVHQSDASLDIEGDNMFGKLIVEELRKMTPAEQQRFKRGVTELLYA